MPTKCTFIKANGEQCKAWATLGTDPPRCSTHNGKPGGAPVGNSNRAVHGFYAQPVKELSTIDDILADAMKRQAQLSSFIDECCATGEADVETMAKLLALHGQNASRLGRLLRDQRALSGASADGLLAAVSAALDEISTELDLPL